MIQLVDLFNKYFDAEHYKLMIDSTDNLYIQGFKLDKNASDDEINKECHSNKLGQNVSKTYACIALRSCCDY